MGQGASPTASRLKTAMLALGGPVSELLASLGATIGGGAVIGSMLGGGFGFLTRADRTERLELAGTGALVVGALSILTLGVEGALGLA